jgi:hypothetical protein
MGPLARRDAYFQTGLTNTAIYHVTEFFRSPIIVEEGGQGGQTQVMLRLRVELNSKLSCKDGMKNKTTPETLELQKYRELQCKRLPSVSYLRRLCQSKKLVMFSNKCRSTLNLYHLGKWPILF